MDWIWGNKHLGHEESVLVNLGHSVLLRPGDCDVMPGGRPFHIVGSDAKLPGSIATFAPDVWSQVNVLQRVEGVNNIADTIYL